MTTIACRDGIMAADSGAWYGDASHGWAKKLARGPDGTLYGITGNAAEGTAFLDWVEAGAKGDAPQPREMPEDGSSFLVLRVPPSGKVEIVGCKGAERYDAPYFAIGAGAQVAFGALFMGATAEQAIEAAKEHGSGAFGRVQMVQTTRPSTAGAMQAPDWRRRVERSWRIASEATGAFRRPR